MTARLLAEPFRAGHMRRRHRCVACSQPTRRTIGRHGGRTVLCSRRQLPAPEVLLLRAILGAESAVDLPVRAEVAR